MLERIICVAIGYVFGLFQTGYLYGKMNGIDIREHGSGNAGATNTLRTLGLKAGAITFFGDAFKCIFTVLLTYLIFKNSHPEYVRLLGVYAAAGTVLGHNYPCHLGFRGGKGIAVTAGLIATFGPLVIVISIATFALVFVTTHFVSLGSILLYLVLVLTLVITGQNGFWGMQQVYLNEMYVLVVLLAALAIWRHKANISRLIKGTERKTYLTKKK